MKSLGSLEDVDWREKEEEKAAEEVAQKKRQLTQTYLAEAQCLINEASEISSTSPSTFTLSSASFDLLTVNHMFLYFEIRVC